MVESDDLRSDGHCHFHRAFAGHFRSPNRAMQALDCAPTKAATFQAHAEAPGFGVGPDDSEKSGIPTAQYGFGDRIVERMLMGHHQYKCTRRQICHFVFWMAGEYAGNAGRNLIWELFKTAVDPTHP